MSERRASIIVGIAAAVSLALLSRVSVDNQQLTSPNESSQSIPLDAVIPPETTKEKDLLTTKIPN